MLQPLVMSRHLLRKLDKNAFRIHHIRSNKVLGDFLQVPRAMEGSVSGLLQMLRDDLRQHEKISLRGASARECSSNRESDDREDQIFNTFE